MRGVCGKSLRLATFEHLSRKFTTNERFYLKNGLCFVNTVVLIFKKEENILDVVHKVILWGNITQSRLFLV